MAKASTFDRIRARELYEEGKTDTEIADMVGAKVATIRSWRQRERLSANRVGKTAGGTRPEVTVEAPEGLKPASSPRAPTLEGFEPVLVPDGEPGAPAPVPLPEQKPDVPEPEAPEEPKPEEPSSAAPRPEPTAAPEAIDPVERVVEYVRSGTDPVTVTISCRGCDIRVEAACLDQVSAAGRLLAGVAELLRDVPVSDTKERQSWQL